MKNDFIAVDRQFPGHSLSPKSVKQDASTEYVTSFEIDTEDFDCVFEPPEVESITNTSGIDDLASASVDEDSSKCGVETDCHLHPYSFLTFRLTFLFVTLVIMLADGLQG